MKAVELENKVIKVVNESKLGVTIDSKLKWKTQVYNAASAMNLKVIVLGKCFIHLEFQHAKTQNEDHTPLTKFIQNNRDVE